MPGHVTGHVMTGRVVVNVMKNMTLSEDEDMKGKLNVVQAPGPAPDPLVRLLQLARRDQGSRAGQGPALQSGRAKCKNQRGGALVEVSLLAPWIFFLFVGVLDMGFYCYALICTENAARAAAIQTAADQYSQTDTIACNAALNELNYMPNVVGVTTCGASPVVVTRTLRCGSAVSGITGCVTGTPTSPAPADSAQSTATASSFVTVTYTTVPLIPIPGALAGQFTFARTSEMRIIQE
jgi:Flp pilus assembly protein TadG